MRSFHPLRYRRQTRSARRWRKGPRRRESRAGKWTTAPASSASPDGHRASEVAVQFSGAGRLDHLNSADLELIEAAKLGGEVLLLVRGTVAAKSFRLVGPPTEGLRFACSVKVDAVEDAERA